MKYDEFVKKLNRKKPYRDLSDEYKTDKFLLLYYKMYEYIESIPKEEIVNKCTKEDRIRYGLLVYINHFLKAKDFYNWKYRIYTLLTKKLSTPEFEKWELLYNSKAEKYYNEYIILNREMAEKAMIEKYGVSYTWQSKELYEKSRKTFKKRYGAEFYLQTKEGKEKLESIVYEKYGVKNISQLEEVKEKKKQTSLKNWGTEWPMQSKEVQEKEKRTNLERRGVEYVFQDKKVREKGIQTNLKKRGVKYVSQDPEFKAQVSKTVEEKFGVKYACLISQSRSHSKIADEFCENLYTMLPDVMKSYTVFQKKDNKEYMLRDKDRIFYFDFTFIRESVKVIVEFDGIYWHGLIEGQKYVLNKSVEEIWKMDMDKQRVAEKNGFVVIRVREDEYLRDKEGCVERVYKQIMDIYNKKRMGDKV